MVVGWAPWWTGQTERTTFLTVGAASQLLPHLLHQAGHMLVAAVIDQLESVQQADLQAQQI
jgi:hypothetical protein